MHRRAINMIALSIKSEAISSVTWWSTLIDWYHTVNWLVHLSAVMMLGFLWWRTVYSKAHWWIFYKIISNQNIYCNVKGAAKTDIQRVINQLFFSKPFYSCCFGFMGLHIKQMFQPHILHRSLKWLHASYPLPNCWQRKFVVTRDVPNERFPWC